MTQITGQPDALVLVDRVGAPSRGWSLARDLASLTKPRIALMVALTTFLGYAITGASIAGAEWTTLAATLIGTMLASMGAATLNQVIERDVDARMERTRLRPTATGRVSPAAGMTFGLTLCILGVGVISALANPLAATLTAITVISYALIYTPMKRMTSVSTIVGAVPGALPPLIGFAAATGAIGPAGWVMFAIMFLWQLPHFLAIAWLYREDYARAGMPMLPVVDPTGGSTFRQMLLGAMALVPLGLLPTVMGVAGVTYFVVALAAGLAFSASAVLLVMNPTRAAARRVFIVSLVYLPVVLATMVLDKVS